MGGAMEAGAVERITIVGAGLVGASIALALRRAQPGCRIVAVDPDPAVREALVPGIADEATDDLAAGLRDAQLVFVACPVGAMPAVLARAGPYGSKPLVARGSRSTPA